MTASAGRPPGTTGNSERGCAFWLGLVVGLAVMSYGIAGLLAHADATSPLKAAEWLVGADLLHDAVLVPLIATAGWLLTRVVPRRVRWPVRAGLIGTALVLAVGWIPLRGYGRLPDNRSLAPLDYGTAVITAITAVWCVCALWAAVVLLLAAHSSSRGREHEPT